MICVLHVDDFFIQLAVPHAQCPPSSPQNRLLLNTEMANSCRWSSRRANGNDYVGSAQHGHSRLLSDLLTVCKSPSSNPVIIPTQKVFSVSLRSPNQSDRYQGLLFGLTDTSAFLNHSSTLLRTRVDILTNVTKYLVSRCQGTRCFGLLLVRKVAAGTYRYVQYGLFM